MFYHLYYLMLITITGKAGSGKSTAAKALAQKLWYEYISIGDMKRKIAAEMWLNIIEFNKLWELRKNQHEFDLKYEDYQRSLDPKSTIILESRLGFIVNLNLLNCFCLLMMNLQPKEFFLIIGLQTLMNLGKLYMKKQKKKSEGCWKIPKSLWNKLSGSNKFWSYRRYNR